ncbi:MAG: hypothetical protein Q9157_005189, partial [Trypethelium eluteriae]
MPPNSFKSVSRDAPLPLRSPSPPNRFIEPLSPAPPAATLSQIYTGGKTNPASGFTSSFKWPDTKERRITHHSWENWDSWNTGITTQTPQNARAHLGHAHPQRSPSTIDTLATVALATSPTYSPISPQGPKHDSLGHSFGAWPTNSAHQQSPINGFTNVVEERPSKRARSEIVPSPRAPFEASRPATSHVPVTWSYNVEQNIENGNKIYNSQSSYQCPETRAIQTGANLYEAELLLGLGRERRHSSIDKGQLAQQTNGYAAQRDSAQFPLGEQLYRAAYGHYQSRDKVAHRDEFAVDDNETVNRTDHVMTSQDEVNTHAPSLKVTTQPLASSTDNLLQTHTPPDDQQGNGKGHTIPRAQELKGKKSKGGKQKQRKESIKNTKQDESLQIPSTSSQKVSKIQQLASPESLVEDHTANAPQFDQKIATPGTSQERIPTKTTPQPRRRRRCSDSEELLKVTSVFTNQHRASSVPTTLDDTEVAINFPGHERLREKLPLTATSAMGKKAVPVTTCKSCGLSQNPERRSEEEVWISCNGCEGWFHWACAGLKNEREVRVIDKFFCRECKPKHGVTTYVRQSSRTKTTVDYAGLNEGILRTSDDDPEHHYIKLFKNGGIFVQPERFPRMRPELVTAEYFERSGGMKEPIVIPAKWNPRTEIPEMEPLHPSAENAEVRSSEESLVEDEWLMRDFEYESVPDDGQDKLDMVIPKGLTVRRVAELLGMEEKIEVIDVKSQEGGQKGWNMRRWADYYEAEGEKPVRNVISLEVSDTKLGRLIRRPKIVRDIDLQDSVWPADEQSRANFPKVQFYCLMSVADCFTDFHIDFGGSSVYYHIIRGKKTFFFIPPEPRHLKKYEEWCMSNAQNYSWLGDQTKCCYRVDLSEGDTMLIPSGWIHAVWTPENSLVIGGNFLTRLHYENQLRVVEIEKATKVARKFRYPFFQKVMWYTAIRYLERDPLPPSVEQLFYDGKCFERSAPIYLDDSSIGERGTERYNARFYSESELSGMTHLVNYIWKTVLIANGKVDGVNSDTRNAVARSIPKGHGLGEPIEVAKLFAMWVSWKRGNEDIPQWAHPETPLPESGEPRVEKKLSVAALKKLERQAAIEAYRVAPDRQSARQAMKAAEAAATKEPSHTSTPKTSVLGPKRIACDACRRRRIRCKHKEEAGASSSSSPKPRRNSSVLVGVVIDSSPSKSFGDLSGRPALQATPTANHVQEEGQTSTDPSSKKPRTKACVDCRKSKASLHYLLRRCIHDEHGNIDPIKAAESPVPRGSGNSKKRKSQGEPESPQVSKKQKGERRASDQLLAAIPMASQDEMMAIDPALMALSEDTVTVATQPPPMAPIAPMAPMTAVQSEPLLEALQTSDSLVDEDQAAVAGQALRIAQEHLLPSSGYPEPEDFDAENESLSGSIIDPQLEMQCQQVESAFEPVAIDPALDPQLQDDYQASQTVNIDSILDPQLQSDYHPKDTQLEQGEATADIGSMAITEAETDGAISGRITNVLIDQSNPNSSEGIREPERVPTTASISGETDTRLGTIKPETPSFSTREPQVTSSSNNLAAAPENIPMKTEAGGPFETSEPVTESEHGEPAMPTTEPIETDCDTTAKASTPQSEEDLTSNTSASRKRAASSPLTDLAEDDEDEAANIIEPSLNKARSVQQSQQHTQTPEHQQQHQQPSRHSSRSSKPVERFAPSSFDPVPNDAARRPSTASSSLSAAECVTLSASVPQAKQQQRRQSSTPASAKSTKTPKKPSVPRGTSAGSVGSSTTKKGDGVKSEVGLGMAVEQREETQEERDAKLARELAGEWA